MQSFPKSQPPMMRSQNRRTAVLLVVTGILLCLFIAKSMCRYSSNNAGADSKEARRVSVAFENRRKVFAEMEASAADYTALLRSASKSLSAFTYRMANSKEVAKKKIGPTIIKIMNAQSSVGDTESWVGVDKIWNVSSLRGASDSSKTDPEEEKQRAEAAKKALVHRSKDELSAYAARIMSDIRTTNENAKDLITSYVAAVNAERYGDPRRGAFQWHAGQPETEGAVPEWGRGDLVDAEDRKDNNLVPPGHNDYVIARKDQRFAPTKNPGINNEDPLAKFGGGIVRQPGDQFVDYDNDAYQGVVNDRPGPPLPTFPDPLNDITDSQERNERRADAIIGAFKHSWAAYHTYSWGCDEIKPRSRSCKNWNDNDDAAHGFGLTILDGMTTAFLMGLDNEVSDALKYIKNEMRFGVDVDGSLFETNIRALGSLISLYELTGEKYQYLLDKAVEVADTLLYAFNTSTGVPHSTVNFRTKRHYGSPWGGGNTILSEMGTVQLEFRTLSLHTANPIYDMKATHIMSIIEARAPDDLLCPLYISNKRLTWAVDHISLGALGDSFYEYIIKQYMLTGNTETRYAKLAVKMTKGLSKLLFRSIPGNLLYLAEHRAKSFHHKMDHLACFAGGMFALLSSELPDLSEEEAANILKLGGDLTETCVKMYTLQATGVSPEFVEFPPGTDMVNGQGFYILRPEAIESVFYMYRYTHDPKWRDYGWAMFRAIDRYCKVPHGGYVGIREVNVPDPPQDNLMQSFWLAETLKYFFLLFSDDSVLNLNEWVLNTEAHPLRRRNRNPLDVWRDYESLHGEVPWFPPPLQGVKPVETVKMTEMRRDGTVRYQDMAQDPLGGDGEEGMPDDEGLPFDEVTGMRGVVRERKGMRDVLLEIGRSINFDNVRRNGRRL